MLAIPKIKFSLIESADGPKLKISLINREEYLKAKWRNYYVVHQKKRQGPNYVYNPRVPRTVEEKIERNKQSAKRYCEKIQKLNKLHKTLKRQGISLV